jgi:hypothetical protein
MELRSVGVEFEAVNDDALMIEGKVNGLDWSKQLGERRRFIEKAKGLYTLLLIVHLTSERKTLKYYG